MYSYFQQRCIHRQTVIVHNVSNQKIEHCTWWTPHVVFKYPPPVWDQCKFCQCYAMRANSTCGMTLVKFLYHGGTLRYPQITHPLAAWKIDDNNEHHHNRDEIISSLSLAPILTTQISSHNTPKPCICGIRWQALATLSEFLSKNDPPSKVTWFQLFIRDNGS